MSKRYVLCLTAANRTGILAAVAKALSELGGDIHEISHTTVADYFALILAADFPERRAPDVIVSHVEGVCRPFGVEVILKDPAHEPADEVAAVKSQPYVLNLTGRDAPGIVARISGCLAREGIDVSHLHGIRRDGGKSFALALSLAVPADVDVATLQKELEQIGQSLGFSPDLKRAAEQGSTSGL
jgi:glycine cleavage system transcriptional repressor